MLRVGHIFAGAGGGVLASEILGHRSLLAVERDLYRVRVLRAMKELGWWPELTTYCADIRWFNDVHAKRWAGRLDCIAAGFPCQDISVAGRGAGIRGKHSGLFFELLRTIDIIRPGLVFLENSPNIRNKGRDQVIAELVARGYSWKDGTLEASHVGAGHKRNRWWLLAANADGKRRLGRAMAGKEGENGPGPAEHPADAHQGREQQQEGTFSQIRRRPRNGGQEAAHLDRPGGIQPPPEGPLQEKRRRNRNRDQAPSDPHELGSSSSGSGIEEHQGQFKDRGGTMPPPDSFRHRLQVAVQRGGLSPAVAETLEAVAGYCQIWNWSPPDSGVLRVVDGLARRDDRIRALGDGQVPLQAAAAWMMLSEE